LGKPKPAWVSVRIRCFIDTVSPARSRLRSSTVWARRSGVGCWLVGTLKRQGSMPRCQSLQVKAMSATPWLGARALTNQACWKSPSQSPSRAQLGGLAGTSLKRARPCASVVAWATGLPWQSLTCTAAPATGRPLSSVVTQARAFSRPSLKCTARLVTSTALRTTMARRAP
jgi:hypothetical protein